MANPVQDDIEALLAQDPISEMSDENLPSLDNLNFADHANDIPTPEAKLTTTVNAYKDEPEENPDVIRYAREWGMDEATTKSLLTAYAPSDAEMLRKAPELNERSPVLTEWAARPENYSFVKNNLSGILALTEKGKFASEPTYIHDLTNALARNMPTLENAVAVGKYSIGLLSKEDFADSLENIRQRRNTQTPYGTSMAGFNKAMQTFNAEMGKNINSFADIADMSVNDWDDFVKVAVKGMQESGATTLDIVNFAYSAIVNTPATILKSVESVGSVLGPTAGTLAGSAAGFAVGAGPIGGAIGGVTGSAFIRYAEEIGEQLNLYRNEKGEIDYEEALNDPETMKNIQKIATTYGLVGGVLDTALTRLGGNLAKGGLLTRTGVDVAGEGVAEAGATTAKGIAKGDSVTESIGAGITEGVVEAILATPTSGATTTISYIPGMSKALSNKLLRIKRQHNAQQVDASKKEKIAEQRKEIESVAKTPEDKAKLSEVFDTLSRLEEVVDPPEDVIDTPTITVAPPPDTGQPKYKSSPRRPTPPRKKIPETATVNAAELFNALSELGKTKEGVSWNNFLETLPEHIAEEFNTALGNEDSVTLPTTEWLMATTGLGHLDNLLSTSPLWGDPADTSEVKPVSPEKVKEKQEEAKGKPEKVEVEPDASKVKAKAPTKSKVDKVFGKFRSVDEENIYNEFKGKIAKVVGRPKRGGKTIAPEAVQLYSDIFFSSIMHRSRILGRPLREMVDSYEVVHTSPPVPGLKTSAYGYAWRPKGSPQQLIYFSTDHIASGNRISTLVHELGHIFLENMVMDWDYIMALDPKAMTNAQWDYKEAMLLTAKFLGTPNLKGVSIRPRGDKFSKHHEKFATTIEMFFKNGDFGDSTTGRLMHRYSQFMQEVMPVRMYNEIGQSYAKKNVTPVSPGDKDWAKVQITVKALMGAKSTLNEEIYPLVPEPDFDKSVFGDAYTDWMTKYREAVEKALMKVMKSIYTDRKEFYERSFPEVFQETYDQLMDAPIGRFHQLIRDGLIVLHRTDVNKRLGLTDDELAILEDSISIVKNKNQSTVTLEQLVQYGFIDAQMDAVTVRQIGDAANLEQTAREEALKKLEAMFDAQELHRPGMTMDEAEDLILNDKDIRRVRKEANRIAIKKYLKDLAESDPDNPLLTEAFKDKFNTDALLRTAKAEWANTPNRVSLSFLKDRQEYEKNREAGDAEILFITLTDRSRQAQLKTTRLSETLGFTRIFDSAKRVKDALKTGEIPVILNALARHEVNESKEYMTKWFEDKIQNIQKGWQRLHGKLGPTQVIEVKNEDGKSFYVNHSGVSSTLLDGLEVSTTIENNDLVGVMEDMVNRSLTQDVATRNNYRNLYDEIYLMSRVNILYNTTPDTKPGDFKEIELKEFKDLKFTAPKKIKSTETESNPIHMPPIPVEEMNAMPATKPQLKWKDTMNTLVAKIQEEVKLFKKVKTAPITAIGRYMYYSSVSMQNFIASMIDEKNLPTSWLNALFQKVTEAEAKKNVEHNRYYEKITQSIGKFTKSKKEYKNALESPTKKGGLFSSLLGLGKNDTGGIAAPELGNDVVFANIGQVIVGLLYAGSKSGKKKFLEGGFVTKDGVNTGPLGDVTNPEMLSANWDAFIKRLVAEGTLNQQAFDLVQEIHDIFNEIYPMVQKSFNEVEGVELNFVEGLPYTMTFADGTKKTYRGGYYPLMKDTTLTSAIISGEQQSTSDDFTLAYDILDSSMQRTRGAGTYPIRLDMGLMMGILNKHLVHAYLKRPLTLIENLKKDKRIVKVFENRQQGFIKEILNPWLKRTARQQYAVPTDPGLLGSAALFVRRTTHIALFFGNVRSMAMQLLGIVQGVPTFAQYVGNAKVLKHTAKVAGSVSTGNYSSLKEDIGKKSVFMKDRMDNNQRNLVRGWDEMDLTQNKREWIKTTAESISFMGLQFTQNIVDMSIWLAAVERTKQDGLSDAQAYAYADRLVERTQASGNISARAGALHGSHFERLSMMISMVAYGLRGRIYEEVARAEANETSVTIARLNALTWLAVMPGLLTGSVGLAIDALTEADDDDDDPEIAKLLANIATDTADAYAPQVNRLALPFVASVIEGAGIEGVRGGELFGLGPVAHPLRKTIRGGRALSRGMVQGIPMTNKDIGNVLTGITIATGLPTSVIDKTIIPFIEANKSTSQKKAESRQRRRIIRKIKRKR